jgi:hypothetical protein
LHPADSRPSKVMSKAFNAAFQRLDQRLRPLPVIWVSEVWSSKEAHDASLQLPETKVAISKAMPMLTGEFSGQEVTIVGGLGA